jgi:ribosomal protein S18 acetylase RimI-like enzyme
VIKPLARSELREAAGVLGRAFCDNPGVRALLAGDPPDVRLRLTETTMHAFAAAVLRAGVAEVIERDGRIAAVSLSFPPGAYPPPLRVELMIAARLLRGGVRRMLRFGQVDAFMRKRHLREPHWYLWVLVLEPELQGQGLGSELLRALAVRAERDHVPCYLETDKPSSVRLYERNGFAVQREEQVPVLDFRLWFMLRAGTRPG